MSCRNVRPLLHADAPQLPETDRLVLEEHLQSCAGCRDERRDLALVRRLGAQLPVESIGPRGHARVIAAALMRGSQPSVEPVSRPAWRWGVASAGVLVLAGLIAYVASRGAPVADAPPAPVVVVEEPLRWVVDSPASTPPAVPPSVPRPSRPVILEGEVMVGTQVLGPDVELPTNTTLRTTKTARVDVYGAQVVIAAASQIVVRERSLVVVRGYVTVASDRGPRRVDAGASWPPGPSEPVPAATALARARAAYTKAAFVDARTHAAQALASDPTRAQAAEAETVIADSLQATGKPVEAIARYAAIAARYADLPAGETALFAGARLTARTDPTAAAALFQRYLVRYPDGRFADDARRALQGAR